MSQENVETVLALYAAWNASEMEEVRERLDPRIVVWNPPDFPEPGPFIGPEGVMRQWEQQRETYQADALKPITKPVYAADRVVIRFIWHGTGQGPQANIEVTGVYAVRRGRIASIEHFWNHAEAVEAAGLSQQDAHAGKE